MPAAPRLKRLYQLAEPAQAICGQDQRWVTFRRLEQCRSARRQVATTPIGERNHQVDLALKAVPGVDGQLSSVQLVVRPRDTDLLRQIRQNAGELTRDGPIHASAHQPDPPSRLRADQEVLCNDLTCL
jgi:shikimate 5-dehydrogenase